MSYASMWYKTDTTKYMAVYYIEKYGHRLEWNDYKENILEVGCAEGSITNNILYPYIKNRVGKLLAVDKLEGMIDFAKRENKIPEIDYQVMDVLDSRATKRYENQFDRTFSFLVAQLIPDNRRFFTALHGMLKPNGQIFVTTIVENYVIRSFHMLFAEEKWVKYAPKRQVFAHYTDDPEKYMRQLLADVGFSVDVCEYELRKYTTENFKDLMRALVHMYVGLGAVSADIPEDFIQEHIKNCEAQCTYVGEPDKYEMPYPLLICIATKIA